MMKRGSRQKSRAIMDSEEEEEAPKPLKTRKTTTKKDSLASKGKKSRIEADREDVEVDDVDFQVEEVHSEDDSAFADPSAASTLQKECEGLAADFVRFTTTEQIRDYAHNLKLASKSNLEIRSDVNRILDAKTTLEMMRSLNDWEKKLLSTIQEANKLCNMHVKADNHKSGYFWMLATRLIICAFVMIVNERELISCYRKERDKKEQEVLSGNAHAKLSSEFKMKYSRLRKIYISLFTRELFQQKFLKCILEFGSISVLAYVEAKRFRNTFPFFKSREASILKKEMVDPDCFTKQSWCQHLNYSTYVMQLVDLLWESPTTLEQYCTSIPLRISVQNFKSLKKGTLPYALQFILSSTIDWTTAMWDFAFFGRADGSSIYTRKKFSQDSGLNPDESKMNIVIKVVVDPKSICTKLPKQSLEAVQEHLQFCLEQVKDSLDKLPNN